MPVFSGGWPSAAVLSGAMNGPGRISEKERGGGGDESTGDPWISSVVGVSVFLGGFSLASVVVISDAWKDFRWPGTAVLVLTVASVVLLLSAQEARRAARFYTKYKAAWRRAIWVTYHVGIITLLAGLGTALPPLGAWVRRKLSAGLRCGLRLARL
jgi:hypothetical protein